MLFSYERGTHVVELRAVTATLASQMSFLALRLSITFLEDLLVFFITLEPKIE